MPHRVTITLIGEDLLKACALAIQLQTECKVSQPRCLGVASAFCRTAGKDNSSTEAEMILAQNAPAKPK